MAQMHDCHAAPLFASDSMPAADTMMSLIKRYLVAPLVAFHRGRVARRDLMELDDRQLADIGLHRHEIELALTAPSRIASRQGEVGRGEVAHPANANRRAGTPRAA